MRKVLPLVSALVWALANCAAPQQSAAPSEPAAAPEAKVQTAAAEPAPAAAPVAESEDADMAGAPVVAAEAVATPAPPPPSMATKAMAAKSMPARPVAGKHKTRRKRDLRKAEAPPTSTGAVATSDQPFNTEAYDRLYENPFLLVPNNPLSTFSIDVDTASYANMRRFLDGGNLPPKDSVRLEELINYFSYDYPRPMSDVPFSVLVDAAACPWNKDHRLVQIGLKGRAIDPGQRKPANLVFLLDVSGSMESPNKLPLLRDAAKLLVNNLNQNDRVAIVVYAGASGLALPSTPASQGPTIIEALERLRAGGSTNAGQGIELAYQIAQENFIPKGVNRVILATDGDFNVGVTSQGDLIRLIEKKAKAGVFLTVLGFGMGNYKDSTLEKLADKGNGNYGYIDTIKEARKVLVEEMGGTLVTIAKDVKIQVEFNPTRVGAYRLLGYENRILRAEDFADDTKDAGEIGAGHTVTALYEIVPPDKVGDIRGVDKLKYQAPAKTTGASSRELLTVKLRYKKPDGNKSRLLEYPLVDPGQKIAQASPDLKFAAAVAAFGMLLRDSEHKGGANFKMVTDLATKSVGKDPGGYRQEFLKLVQKARKLKR